MILDLGLRMLHERFYVWIFCDPLKNNHGCIKCQGIFLFAVAGFFNRLLISFKPDKTCNKAGDHGETSADVGQGDIYIKEKACTGRTYDAAQAHK